MSSINIKDRDGNWHKLEANIGMTIMEIIRDAGLDIEAACGGCCACATCHVYVEDGWINKTKSKNEDEESMLDQAFHVESNSRLSCQIDYIEDLDGIRLVLAPE